jgi:hypothetical protein
MAVPIAGAVATAARPLVGNLLRLLPFFGAGAAGQLLIQAATQQDGIKAPENITVAIRRKTFEVGIDPSTGNLVLIPAKAKRRKKSTRLPKAASEALKTQK